MRQNFLRMVFFILFTVPNLHATQNALNNPNTLHSDPNLPLAQQSLRNFAQVRPYWLPAYDRYAFYQGLEQLHQLVHNLRNNQPNPPPPPPPTQKPTVFIHDGVIKGSAADCSDEAEQLASGNALNACFQAAFKKCDAMSSTLTKLRRWHDYQLNTWYDCEAEATVHGYK